jgi:NTE family protein
MLQALFSTMVEAHDERYIEKHNRFRTVMIPTKGVRTTEFDLSEEKCDLLYQSGLESTRNFYSGWTFTEYMKQFDKYVVHSGNVR